MKFDPLVYCPGRCDTLVEPGKKCGACPADVLPPQRPRPRADVASNSPWKKPRRGRRGPSTSGSDSSRHARSGAFPPRSQTGRNDVAA